MIKDTIQAKGVEISVLTSSSQADYISLTDIARYINPKEPKDVIKNRMRSRNTIEFLGLWEQLNNPDFKGVEFDSFREKAGLYYSNAKKQSTIHCLAAILLTVSVVKRFIVSQNDS